MFVGAGAVWQPAMWMRQGRRELMAYPKRQAVTGSCALSRALSATFGMGSPRASAKIAVKRSRISPALLMG